VWRRQRRECALRVCRRAMDGCPATDDVDATTARWDDEDGMECGVDQMSRSHTNGWQVSSRLSAASGSLLEQLRAQCRPAMRFDGESTTSYATCNMRDARLRRSTMRFVMAALLVGTLHRSASPLLAVLFLTKHLNPISRRRWMLRQPINYVHRSGAVQLAACVYL
jgi:hypothetical protein